MLCEAQISQVIERNGVYYEKDYFYCITEYEKEKR